MKRIILRAAMMLALMMLTTVGAWADTETFSSDDLAVSSDGTEYTIKTAKGWGHFCDMLDEGETFSGKTVKLGANIGTAQNPITRMAGTSGHDFCGTFDGQGNTLTVNITGTSKYAGPFLYVKSQNDDNPVTIRNLSVTGSITTGSKFAAGITGGCSGKVNIKDCHVSTVIYSSTGGDGTHGGIVGNNGATLTIEGCVFDGKLLSTGETATTRCGGFVGWCNSTTTISNCLYAPAALEGSETEVGTTESCTLGRYNAATVTIENSYYTRLLGTAQGTQAHSIKAGANVTLALSGTGTTYSTSGITAYKDGDTQKPGVKYGDVLYAGQGEEVSLTLSHGDAPEGYSAFNGYTASAGTLDGSMLTMPDEDVIIGATFTAIDWTGDGKVNNPYIIIYPSQLDLLAQRVNSGKPYSGKYFELGSDITYTHTTDWNDATSTENNYTAIGTGSTGKHFKGHFDGKNHVISGIRIYKGGNTETDQNQGIFGRISSAEVKNIILADTRITGFEGCGGIAGGAQIGSTIENCHVLSTVTIHGVQQNAECLGGIAGSIASDIKKISYLTGCTSAASITISGNATKCTIIGGIAGFNASATVKDCIYLGNTIEGNSYIGAIIGRILVLTTINTNEHIRNCYYTSPTITGKDGSGNKLSNAYCAIGSKNDIPGLAPKDEADNSEFLTLMAARYDALTDAGIEDGVDITLNGRTLTKNDDWNTICLPFDVTLKGSVLEGATVKKLNGEKSKLDDKGTLTLSFDDEKETLTAGQPYIIKWDTKGSDLENPVFTGVTITSTTPEAITSTDHNVKFVGQYNPFDITEENKNEIIMLSSGNRLGYSKNPRTLHTFRCHFEVPASSGEQMARSFVMDFGGEETGIETTDYTNYSDAWYTIDGRKLDSVPTKKGLYIHKGKKVVKK